MYLDVIYHNSLILVVFIIIFLKNDMDDFYRSIGINKQSNRDFRAEIMSFFMVVILIGTFFIDYDLFNKMFIILVYIILGLIWNRELLNEKIVIKKTSADDNEYSFLSINLNMVLGIWLLFYIYYLRVIFPSITLSEYELMILWSIYYIYEFIMITLVMFFPRQFINKIELITGYNATKKKEYENIVIISAVLTFLIPYIIVMILINLL
ncbi:hypothetical protein [Methanosphaera sp. WGK6]|uniref:hypothetical protein n=1 Tax=Methanosphaera sp. WGK6 TaxID=1561964 RepID=UPI00084C8500|nr:hypothetical protein [Methanosphaera sp. WGK6]OED29976.1 hypothetical protein NL43_05350 [Methanosphaera sp. WGK6]